MNYEQLVSNIQAYAENTESLFVASIPVFVQQAEHRIYNSVQIPALRKNVIGTMSAGNQYISLPNDWLSNYSIALIDENNNYNFLINKDVNFLREAYPSVVSSGSAFQGTPQGVPKYYALFGPQYNDVNEMSLMVAPTPKDSYTVEMHYFYYPPTIIQGLITGLSLPFNPGSLYTNGVYQNVQLTGGSGFGATADIVVVNQAVTNVTLKFGGNFYVVGDTLSCASLGPTGSGFSINVGTISSSTGTSWLGDNYDPVLFYGAMREAMLFMKGEQDMVAYYQKMYEEALAQLKRLGDGLERGDAYRDGQTRLLVKT